MRGALIVNEVEVLIDGIGGADEPARAEAHLRGDRGHIVAQQRRHPPRLSDVTIEAVALVLGQHDDFENAGVGEI